MFWNDCVLTRVVYTVKLFFLFWYILCSCDDRLLPGVGLDGTECLPTPGSKPSSQLHKMYQNRCTANNSWWWAERLSETCRIVIPIKLEFGASVGFIHKEYVTMHGHTIVKFSSYLLPTAVIDLIVFTILVLSNVHALTLLYQNNQPLNPWQT